jgi:predicted flap endonuclease-1-like 5' DNA nuclease
MKYCPNCGSGVDAGDTYCYECGEDLTEKGTEHPETKEDGEVPENEEEAEDETEAEAKEETETEEEKEPEEEAEEAQENREVPESEAKEEVKDEEARGSSIDITNIGAVGETKAEALRDAGYETIEDLREATQEEIAEVENIGEALSARIKSNADRMEVKREVRKDEGSGISISSKALFVLVILVVVGGVALLGAGGGDAGLDNSPDSSDTQDSGTTDGSSGGNEETSRADSSEADGRDNQDSVLQYGETYTRSNGVEITVESVETIDFFSANGVTQTPEKGNMFVQVYVTARNTADGEQFLPYQSDFNLIFQNRQYGTAPFGGLKDDAYEGTSAQPGIVRDGSIVFETTEEADLSEIQIVWSGLDESATWSAS